MSGITIDVSCDAFIARTAICEEVSVIRSEMTRASVLFKPTLSADGDQWCALLGETLATGVSGFGNTPAAAMAAFDLAFANEETPTARLAKATRDGGE